MAPKPRTKKPVKKEENVKPVINEIDALGDIPELQAPKELMDLLDNKTTVPTVRTTEDQSSDDEEFEEVEVEPEVPIDGPVIEVNLPKKKKTKEEQLREEHERQLRIAADKEKRNIIEDCHKLSFLLHMAHVRYQMVCAKKLCEKFSSKLSKFARDLTGGSDAIEKKISKFSKKFKHVKSKLPVETSLNASVDRLLYIMENSVYENDKDLVMAFVILLLSAGFPCRVCVGFTAKPDLPGNTKKNLDKLKIFEKEEDESDVDEPKPKRKKVLKKEKDDLKENYWAEYFDEDVQDWVPIHPANDKMFCVEDVEKYKPFKYALAMDNDLNIFDITGWYQKRYLDIAIRKSRLSDTWIRLFFELPAFTSVPKRRFDEDRKLREYLLSKPLPKTFKEFKDHPLYVLERDLLKFEAIYPKDTASLGKVRKEDIYPRSSVYVLKNRLNWIKSCRSVIEGETGYKVVKAPPKLNIPADQRVQLFMDVFGFWQTVPYILPKVVNGRIERNEFGNVYLFKPSMLPLNCVHLRLAGIGQLARKLGLEAAPAVVGWDFKKGRNYPVIDGCVVLENDAETLNEAWPEWNEEQEKKKEKAKSKSKAKKR